MVREREAVKQTGKIDRTMRRGSKINDLVLLEMRNKEVTMTRGKLLHITGQEAKNVRNMYIIKSIKTYLCLCLDKF